MNAGKIWWGQIGNSLRLLTKLTYNLRDGRSAVLHTPRNFPWRPEFYEAMDLRRASFSGERRLIRRQWPENGPLPDRYLLNSLCPQDVVADYWPGESIAKYLASRADLLLHDYDIWITGIRREAELREWIKFIADYDRCASNLDHRAVFILEYEGDPVEVPGIESIPYTVEVYDCRVFCLETAAAINNTDIHVYQAELALCIGGGDPMFCNALLHAGESFVRDPVKTALALNPGLTEQTINSAAWKAAVVLLFPILEQFRMDFVAKYSDELSSHLPIYNSNGDKITDPCDLEIGPLCYVVSCCGKIFSPAEDAALRLSRKVRNQLAHNKIVPYDDIRKLMGADPGFAT